MKKTFLETIEVFIAAIALTVIVFAITGAGVEGILNEVCDNIILIALVLMLDDVFFKFNRYRRILACWEYWVGFVLELLCVVSFAVARNATTTLFTYLGLSWCLAFAVAVVIYDWKVYNIITLSEEELQELAYRARAKKFPQMDADAIKKDLYSVLKVKFKEDNIELGLDFDRPLNGSSCKTVDEISHDANSIELATPMVEYIDQVVDAYIIARAEKTKKSDAKEGK